MQIKCDYCSTVYEDTLNRCPTCGASNTKRNIGDIRPRTIEELKMWYADRRALVPNTTGFFIDEDYVDPWLVHRLIFDKDGNLIVVSSGEDW